MELNISDILSEKLAQMERDGVIKRKIEESLEKTVLSAISSELDSYSLRQQIAAQVREHVGGVAEQLGLSAYNEYLAVRVRDIVRDLYTEDIAEKVRKYLSDTLLQKHGHVKLSEIFQAYRDWVNEYVDSDDQRERENYTAALDVRVDGRWKDIRCRFAEDPDGEDSPDVEIRFMVWGDEEKTRVSALYLDGNIVGNLVKIGGLSEFECFAANLYFNETEVEMDIGDVPTDTRFEAACDD